MWGWLMRRRNGQLGAIPVLLPPRESVVSFPKSVATRRCPKLAGQILGTRRRPAAPDAPKAVERLAEVRDKPVVYVH